MPVWAQLVVGIVLGALGLWINDVRKQKEKKAEDDLVVKTNPPDPDSIADIDAIQRVQDDRNIPSGE